MAFESLSEDTKQTLIVVGLLKPPSSCLADLLPPAPPPRPGDRLLRPPLPHRHHHRRRARPGRGAQPAVQDIYHLNNVLYNKLVAVINFPHWNREVQLYDVM